jgi:hypothetical protein
MAEFALSRRSFHSNETVSALEIARTGAGVDDRMRFAQPRRRMVSSVIIQRSPRDFAWRWRDCRNSPPDEWRGMPYAPCRLRLAHPWSRCIGTAAVLRRRDPSRRTMGLGRMAGTTGTLRRFRRARQPPKLILYGQDGDGVPSAHPIEGTAMINQAVLGGRMDQRDQAFPEMEREDDLGFMAGLRLLIPVGVLLWVVVAFLLIRFL